MGREYPFTKTVEFMKDNFKKMKKADLEFKYIRMEIYILATFPEIRNTGRVHYIGSVCAKIIKSYNSIIKLNSIMENGGVAYLMVKGNTLKLMVNIDNYLGDHYVGIFKNGLKHGDGIEKYGNGDKYEGQYVNGLAEGYGEYTWADGSVYRGDFKQGYRNGYGMWKTKNES